MLLLTLFDEGYQHCHLFTIKGHFGSLLCTLYLPYLYEVIQHEGGDACPAPLGVCEDEGDVGLVILDVRHHEGEANDELPTVTK